MPSRQVERVLVHALFLAIIETGGNVVRRGSYELENRCMRCEMKTWKEKSNVLKYCGARVRMAETAPFSFCCQCSTAPVISFLDVLKMYRLA